MTDAPIGAEVSTSVVCPPAGPQWPAWVTILTAPWLPATTARRTQHVSLRAAFVVHAVSLVLAIVLCWHLAWWPWWGRMWHPRLQGSLWMFDWLTHPFLRGVTSNTWQMTYFGWVRIAWIEIGSLLLALLVTPWGAADEPLLNSIRHALRRVWLQTPQVLAVLLLVLPVDKRISLPVQNYLSQEWLSSQSDPPWPQPPAGAGPGSAAWSDYSERYQAYQRAIVIPRLQRRPWLVRYHGPLMEFVTLVPIAWAVWALLRAVGQPRAVVLPPHPPTCEACGYNLTLMPMDSRCPECGAAVIESLGPQVGRVGTPWQRRRELGRLRAWRQTLMMAVLRPGLLGRQIRAFQQETDDHSLLALNVVLICLVMTPAMILWDFGLSLMPPLWRFWTWEVLYFRSGLPAIWLWAGGLTLGVTLLAALLIGGLSGRKNGRNMWPAAMRVASCLSGFLLVSVLVCDAAALGMAKLNWVVLRSWGLRLGGRVGMIVAILGPMLLPLAVLLVAYFVLVHRGTAAARHANR